MKRPCIAALVTAFGLVSATAFATPAQPAVQLFPLADVRLGASPFLEAQQTDYRYLMELDPARLIAPFQREAGLPLAKASYENWESSGLDGHMGGHYLSALALMFAATGDEQVRQRLNEFVTQLKACQDKNGDGYLGGIPGGREIWQAIAQGKLQADSFQVNGKWVPWYNLHKTFAGLRDAYRYAGNREARSMLIALSDWALRLTSHLTPEQMQTMLRSEHGGMNEVLADVAQMTGEKKYLVLAERFSDRKLLQPLSEEQDQLTGLHANTQIPKVVGFKRIADMTGERQWQQAAQFFWQTVHDHRTVAIGGNSVKEHFNDEHDFSSMMDDVEGPETCNTYNMLKLTELLFLTDPKVAYSDYYERALYNHILSSQRPESGGFVYFTPMRPNHYRVYSQVDKAMWCCVGSGLESQAKYGEFIYAHTRDALYVNLFIASTLEWREQGVRVTQINNFPDEAGSAIVLHGDRTFTLQIRNPEWVANGQFKLRVNGRAVAMPAAAGRYVSLRRHWRDGDRVEIDLPMQTHLEQMPDKSNYYAVLHGPIVLAAKTSVFAGEELNVFADESRMGHIAHGQICPQDSVPVLVSDTRDFFDRFKPVPGRPLTFTAPGLVQGKDVDNVIFIPFFRLHDSRYMIYWPYSTPENLSRMQSRLAETGAGLAALAAQTIDQVAPGEQQAEVDHAYAGEGAESGIANDTHWRRASSWFSYQLSDTNREAKTLRLTVATQDAGRKFDVLVNGQLLKSAELAGDAPQALYTLDVALPETLVHDSGGRLLVKFVAHHDAPTASIYGVRLLR
ncbi:MAG TPA: glycoside hydrolase family 127 protein [Burkholderiaceae bacterium]